MHSRNYVHTRVHPSSIRQLGPRNNHVRLSRMMFAQKYSEDKTVNGFWPETSGEVYFLSPERFRQTVDLVAITTPQSPMNIPPETAGHWDGKKDDVWAFGCTVFYLLTGELPLKSSCASARDLFGAHCSNQIHEQIIRDTNLSDGAVEFLFWILDLDQTERPSMNQVMLHPWLAVDKPTSPANAPHLSTNPEVYAKTFNQLQKRIDDKLVKEMAQSGYAIEYKLGGGGFGAVYK